MNDKEKKARLIIESGNVRWLNQYKIFDVPYKISKNYLGYFYIEEDIKMCLDYLSLLKTADNPVLLTALTNSLVVLYGKCFSSAGNGIPILNSKNIFKNAEQFLPTHEMLMNLRHKHIAHRDIHHYEWGNTFYLIPLKIKPNSLFWYHLPCVANKKTSFTLQEFSDIENVLKHIHHAVKEKMGKLFDPIDQYMKSLNKKEAEEMQMNDILHKLYKSSKLK